MTPAAAPAEIDAIAWQFLCSPYIDRLYWAGSLERRIDAFLRHEHRADLLNDGAAYGSLVDRVMANIPRARSAGRFDHT